MDKGHSSAEYLREWRKRNPERSRAIHKRWREKVRRQALVHYGGDPPACACCGEKVYEFLTIDHVDGNGAQERRRQGHRGGIQQYSWLRREGYPPGYQVLCWNCNCAVGLYGSCPHQRTNS